MNWTQEEVAKLLAENRDLGIDSPFTKRSPKPRHKYNAIRTEYKGLSYASKKEAKHAEDLDLRVKAGDLSFWLRQVPFQLPGGVVYRADFAEFERVANTALFSVAFVDVKGMDTPVSKLKRRQVKDLYGVEIELI